jgi:hypothetical protein
MASALDRDWQGVSVCEAQPFNDILGGLTPDDHRWAPVDHRVENASRSLVLVDAGEQDLPTQLPGELRSSSAADACRKSTIPFGCPHCHHIAPLRSRAVDWLSVSAPYASHNEVHPPSSAWPYTQEITGSNPVRGTSHGREGVSAAEGV